MTGPLAPEELVLHVGGRYARALGIDLAARNAGERFKWFLAAVLYGARISESLASRTWREFAAHGVLTPERILKTGWDKLVEIVDAGGYVRYDYKTATRGMPAAGFADFKSALVHEGLRLRRQASRHPGTRRTHQANTVYIEKT